MIDTSFFRAKYRVDDEGKWAHYASGKCCMCGKETDQCDASLLWDGIVTYICSDECSRKYRDGLVNQTKED